MEFTISKVDNVCHIEIFLKKGIVHETFVILLSNIDFTDIKITDELSTHYKDSFIVFIQN